MLDIVETSLHPSKSEWVFLRELRVGTGRSRHSLQRLDAFALNCFPHLGMKRVCYEVKASRADFLCEMKQPLKRRMGLHFSNQFFFVTPAGMLALDEVPTECGLIEVGRAPTYGSQRGCHCIVSIAAPWRDTPAPTWQFAASMLRNQQRAFREKPLASPKQLRLEWE
jgi:hypothetical protein